jgi:hypothetical protein
MKIGSASEPLNEKNKALHVTLKGIKNNGNKIGYLIQGLINLSKNIIHLCGGRDSNPRKPELGDLESRPFGHLGTPAPSTNIVVWLKTYSSLRLNFKAMKIFSSEMLLGKRRKSNK